MGKNHYYENEHIDSLANRFWRSVMSQKGAELACILGLEIGNNLPIEQIILDQKLYNDNGINQKVMGDYRTKIIAPIYEGEKLVSYCMLAVTGGIFSAAAVKSPIYRIGMLSVYTHPHYRSQGYASQAMINIGLFVDAVASQAVLRDGCIIAEERIIKLARPFFPVPLYNRNMNGNRRQYHDYALMRRSLIKKNAKYIPSYEECYERQENDIYRAA